jgi:hypothetical protein
MTPLSFRTMLAVPMGIATIALLAILKIAIQSAARHAVATPRRPQNRQFPCYENVQVKRPFFLFRADKY